MSRPYPIIRIGSKFTNTRWWRSNEANIIISNRAQSVKLVPLIVSLYIHRLKGAELKLAFYILDICSNFFLPLFFGHGWRHPIQDKRGYILYFANKTSKKAWVGYFILMGFRPKSLFEQVVFKAGVRLNLTITAVMICE